MEIMAEDDFADGLGLDVDFVHQYTTLVTRFTVLGYTES